jgi:thiol-disulfide isomerase/thioredoxin
MSLLVAVVACAQQGPKPAEPPQPVFKEVLVVPEGTPQEKLQFFEQLKRRRPNFTSNEEAAAHFKRIFETIAAGSQKLLDSKLSPDLETQALAAHFEALVLLDQLKDERAAAPMLALAEKLKDHKERELADYARIQLMQNHLGAVLDAKPGAPAKLLAEAKAYASSGRPTGERFQTLRTAAQMLETMGNYEPALELFDTLQATFLKSGNGELMAAAHDTAQAARTRIGMIGKPVAFESTTIDGMPFDFASLKGKVVLIDFWATWCGPCIRQIPNIKKTYEKYHDRGFEVVGISIDEDRSALQSFLKDSEIPWQTMFSDNLDTTAALKKQFGVESIPCMLLVGRDGKVITLKLMGDELGKELEKLTWPEKADVPAKN